MKIALRVLNWIGRGLLGIAVVLALCWWLIPDQALDAEVEQFLAADRRPPSSDNGIFAIWGFTASPELDPYAVGHRIVAAHDQALSTDKNLDKFKLDSFFGERPLAFPTGSARICDFRKTPCLALYQSKQAEIEAQFETYKVYLARYRNIREYPVMSHVFTQTPTLTPLESLGCLIRVSDLVDGSIALLMKSKATQKAALDELAAEIILWRRLLQSNDGIITQMIATNTLGGKYRLASEILNNQPEIVSAHQTLVATITAPLAIAETNLTTSFGADTLFGLSTLRSEAMKRILRRDGNTKSPFHSVAIAGSFRENATQNEFYRSFVHLSQFLAKSPRIVLEQHKAYIAERAKINEFMPRDVFYNPLGRYLGAKRYEEYVEYAFRVNDVIGLSRLLDLQRRVIDAKLTPNELPAFLAATDSGLMNLYTEQPMRWDAVTQSISFAGQSTRKTEFGYLKLAHFR